MLAEPDCNGLTAFDVERPASSWLSARNRTGLFSIAGTSSAALVGAIAVVDPRLGVAIVLAGGLVVWVLLRPFVGGFVLAVLVPVTSGFAPGLPIPSVRASEAIVGVVGVTLLVSSRTSEAKKWEALDWCALAYGLAWFAFAAIDSVTLHDRLSSSEWGVALGQLQFFLIYRGIRLSVRTAKERRVVLTAVLVASVPVSLLAILQQLQVHAISTFLYGITGSAESSPSGTASPLSIGDIHRATGPFANWTSLSGYAFVTLLVCCSLGLGGQVARRRWWFAAIITLAFGALLASEEQSAIICLLAGVIALGVMHGQLKLVLRWLLVGSALAALVFGPMIAQRVTQETTSAGSHSLVPQTLAYRSQVWTGQYLPAIEDRPLTGYGVVTPPTIQWQYSESQYVTFLMEGGLPLLLLFGALTWAMLRRSLAGSRSTDPLNQSLGRALTVSIMALIVMDVVWPYLSNGGLPQLLWALLALAEPLRLARSRHSALVNTSLELIGTNTVEVP